MEITLRKSKGTLLEVSHHEKNRIAGTCKCLILQNLNLSKVELGEAIRNDQLKHCFKEACKSPYHLNLNIKCKKIRISTTAIKKIFLNWKKLLDLERCPALLYVYPRYFSFEACMLCAPETEQWLSDAFLKSAEQRTYQYFSQSVNRQASRKEILNWPVQYEKNSSLSRLLELQQEEKISLLTPEVAAVHEDLADITEVSNYKQTLEDTKRFFTTYGFSNLDAMEVFLKTVTQLRLYEFRSNGSNHFLLYDKKSKSLLEDGDILPINKFKKLPKRNIMALYLLLKIAIRRQWGFSRFEEMASIIGFPPLEIKTIVQDNKKGIASLSKLFMIQNRQLFNAYKVNGEEAAQALSHYLNVENRSKRTKVFESGELLHLKTLIEKKKYILLRTEGWKLLRGPEGTFLLHPGEKKCINWTSLTPLHYHPDISYQIPTFRLECANGKLKANL